ncbi:MAG TPA: DUF3144 domain-containing protein [Burkholderiaceae bacterium]|nr:DUF3144 domain-containing protein [Burkholderiaceae bacterium]
MQRDYELPDEFRDAADRFVSLAKQLGETRSHDWVRAVLMYAAARYSAFNWLNSDDAAIQAPDEAATYFASEYRTMFRESLKELEPAYRGHGKASA